jgi:hypothetical protein
MGGLVSGIFDLASGDPAAGEENKLDALGNYQTGVGEGLTTAGAAFDESILSGDPSRIAQTLVPEISAGQTGVEQQALQNANFGTRSGGTAASTNAAQAGERANIIDLEGGLEQGAASSALGAGSGLLSGASGNIQSEAGLANQRRQQVNSDVGNIAQSAAAIAAPFLGGAGAAAPGMSSPQLTDLPPEMGAAPANFNWGDTGIEPVNQPDLSIFE